MKKIAIFASGSGTNAEAIMEYFKDRDDVRCELLICNRKNAGVYDRCSRFGVESFYFPKSEWVVNHAANVLNLLDQHQIDLIVLAGFLAIIPSEMVQAYGKRIINIHPSLLPKHGGMGMWGLNVHQDVLNCNEKESGITIHYVSEDVDGGEIIRQERCEVLPDDTAESLAARVHTLEHSFFPQTIDSLLK